jgi:hypothetical protein
LYIDSSGGVKKMINELQKCFFSYTVAKELEKELEKAINEGKDYFVVKTGYGSTK